MESVSESSSSIGGISKKGYLQDNGKSCRNLASFFQPDDDKAFDHIMRVLKSKIYNPPIKDRSNFNLGSLMHEFNQASLIEKDKISECMGELFSHEWLKQTIRSSTIFSRMLCYNYKGNILTLCENECEIIDSILRDVIFYECSFMLYLQLQQVLNNLSPEAIFKKFTEDKTVHRIYQKAIVEDPALFIRVFEVEGEKLEELCHHYKMEEFLLEHSAIRKRFLMFDHSQHVNHKGYMSLLVTVLLLLNEKELGRFFLYRYENKEFIHKILDHEHIHKQGPYIVKFFKEAREYAENLYKWTNHQRSVRAQRPIYAQKLSENFADDTTMTSSESLHRK